MTGSELSAHDVDRMLRITRDYDPPGADEALPWELLEELKGLVPCDQLSLNGQDTPRWETFASQLLPADDLSGADAQTLEAAFRRHYWASTCSYPDRTGDIVSVTMLSDFLPGHSYRHTAMYVEYIRPLGFEHEMMLCLPAGPLRTLRLLFFRGPGADFTERDRAVLTLLRPHLHAAWLASQRRGGTPTPLTGRQREAMALVAAGLSNRQVGRRLGISEATVRKHLENAFARLGVSSRTEAVARLTAVPGEEWAGLPRPRVAGALSPAS